MTLHPFRLTPGSDLRAELLGLVAAHGFRAACIVTGVGSLSHARLRMPGAPHAPELIRTFAEPLEIVALGGTLGPEGLHVHIGLSRADASLIGGHLCRGCIVNTTAELVICDLPGAEFHRRLDPLTGCKELVVQPAHGAGGRG